MTKAEIKAELKAISKLMDENIVGAWDGDLQDTVDAVVLGDFDNNCEGEEFSEDKITKYNGWNERLEKLIKSI